MKKICIVIFTLVASLASAQSIDLYNGKNLDNWTAFTKEKSSNTFVAKDGFICVKGQPFGYIRTNQKYANFKLHVEWIYPKEEVNSGIFLFVQDPLKIWPNAIECQLMKGKEGDFVLLGGSDIAEYKAPFGQPRPKFPVVKRTETPNKNPKGEWNCADIICENGDITVYINGKLVNKGTKSMHKEGYIALQSEGGEIHFRNIVLTPIEK